MNDFNAISASKPTNEICSELVEVCVVGRRCVYLNNHRIAGGKPYYTENLPQHEFDITLRSALAAFTIPQLEAYIAETEQREAYFEFYHTNQEKEA